MGAFHLVKNSENSGSGLNEKRFFGSPNWKIPRKSGTAQKVVPFSRLERPDWLLVFQLHLPGNLSQFQAHGKLNRLLSVTSNLSKTDHDFRIGHKPNKCQHLALVPSAVFPVELFLLLQLLCTKYPMYLLSFGSET